MKKVLLFAWGVYMTLCVSIAALAGVMVIFAVSAVAVAPTAEKGISKLRSRVQSEMVVELAVERCFQVWWHGLYDGREQDEVRADCLAEVMAEVDE
jgi:hypothetical protein